MEILSDSKWEHSCGWGWRRSAFKVQRRSNRSTRCCIREVVMCITEAAALMFACFSISRHLQPVRRCCWQMELLLFRGLHHHNSLSTWQMFPCFTQAGRTLNSPFQNYFGGWCWIFPQPTLRERKRGLNLKKEKENSPSFEKKIKNCAGHARTQPLEEPARHWKTDGLLCSNLATRAKEQCTTS